MIQMTLNFACPLFPCLLSSLSTQLLPLLHVLQEDHLDYLLSSHLVTS